MGDIDAKVYLKTHYNGEITLVREFNNREISATDMPRVLPISFSPNSLISATCLTRCSAWRFFYRANDRNSKRNPPRNGLFGVLTERYASH